MLRLPRSHIGAAAWSRIGLPSAGSTISTSAPKSAKTIVATAPAWPLLRSITRRSSSGPVTGCLPRLASVAAQPRRSRTPIRNNLRGKYS